MCKEECPSPFPDLHTALTQPRAIQFIGSHRMLHARTAATSVPASPRRPVTALHGVKKRVPRSVELPWSRTRPSWS
eukprot:4237084-Prymnesium_polylepis.2